MNIASIFIKRPVMTTLVMLAILLFGIMAYRQLPPYLPAPPSYSKVNPADTPVIYRALASETMPMNDLDEYAETLMAQRISTVEGVAQVQVYGSQKYAVRIQVDPRQLATRGV